MLYCWRKQTIGHLSPPIIFCFLPRKILPLASFHLCLSSAPFILAIRTRQVSARYSGDLMATMVQCGVVYTHDSCARCAVQYSCDMQQNGCDAQKIAPLSRCRNVSAAFFKTFTVCAGFTQTC